MPFKPGKSGNPSGRPKKPAVKALEKAIKEVEIEKGINFLKVSIETALKEPSVMVAILKKVLPDLKQVEAQVSNDINYGVIMLPAKLPPGAPCE